MSLRDQLRSIRAPRTDLPTFDPDAAPSTPYALFGQWLTTAIEGDVSQPNAMTLSTASKSGAPSARTLLLKDVDESGFWFASLSTSRKGADLTDNPRGALTIYWREHGRQVRVVGSVRPGPRAVSEQDFRARHPVARAQAIAGDQSEPMPDTDTVEKRLQIARNFLETDSDFVPDTWNAYIVEPETVEFWQAAAGHEQLRFRYRRVGEGWVGERLWP